MEVLLELEKAELRYNQETNAIELIWKQMHDEETYKTVFTEGIKFLQEKKATCWLSDIRKEGVVSPANSLWMQEEILPKAIGYGLKKVAVIMKPDVFQEFYVKNISRNVEKGGQLIQYFDSTEEANKWFKEA